MGILSYDYIILLKVYFLETGPPLANDCGEDMIDRWVKFARFNEGDIIFGLFINLRKVGVFLVNGESVIPGSSSLGML